MYCGARVFLRRSRVGLKVPSFANVQKSGANAGRAPRQPHHTKPYRSVNELWRSLSDTVHDVSSDFQKQRNRHSVASDTGSAAAAVRTLYSLCGDLIRHSRQIPPDVAISILHDLVSVFTPQLPPTMMDPHDVLSNPPDAVRVLAFAGSHTPLLAIFALIEAATAAPAIADIAQWLYHVEAIVTQLAPLRRFVPHAVALCAALRRDDPVDTVSAPADPHQALRASKYLATRRRQSFVSPSPPAPAPADPLPTAGVRTSQPEPPVPPSAPPLSPIAPPTVSHSVKVPQTLEAADSAVLTSLLSTLGPRTRHLVDPAQHPHTATPLPAWTAGADATALVAPPLAARLQAAPPTALLEALDALVVRALQLAHLASHSLPPHVVVHAATVASCASAATETYARAFLRASAPAVAVALQCLPPGAAAKVAHAHTRVRAPVSEPVLTTMLSAPRGWWAVGSVPEIVTVVDAVAALTAPSAAHHDGPSHTDAADRAAPGGDSTFGAVLMAPPPAVSLLRRHWARVGWPHADDVAAADDTSVAVVHDRASGSARSRGAPAPGRAPGGALHGVPLSLLPPGTVPYGRSGAAGVGPHGGHGACGTTASMYEVARRVAPPSKALGAALRGELCAIVVTKLVAAYAHLCTHESVVRALRLPPSHFPLASPPRCGQPDPPADGSSDPGARPLPLALFSSAVSSAARAGALVAIPPTDPRAAVRASTITHLARVAATSAHRSELAPPVPSSDVASMRHLQLRLLHIGCHVVVAHLLVVYPHCLPLPPSAPLQADARGSDGGEAPVSPPTQARLLHDGEALLRVAAAALGAAREPSCDAAAHGQPEAEVARYVHPVARLGVQHCLHVVGALIRQLAPLALDLSVGGGVRPSDALPSSGPAEWTAVPPTPSPTAPLYSHIYSDVLAAAAVAASVSFVSAAPHRGGDGIGGAAVGGTTEGVPALPLLAVREPSSALAVWGAAAVAAGIPPEAAHCLGFCFGAPPTVAPPSPPTPSMAACAAVPPPSSPAGLATPCPPWSQSAAFLSRLLSSTAVVVGARAAALSAAGVHDSALATPRGAECGDSGNQDDTGDTRGHDELPVKTVWSPPATSTRAPTPLFALAVAVAARLATCAFTVGAAAAAAAAAARAGPARHPPGSGKVAKEKAKDERRPVALLSAAAAVASIISAARVCSPHPYVGDTPSSVDLHLQSGPSTDGQPAPTASSISLGMPAPPAAAPISAAAAALGRLRDARDGGDPHRTAAGHAARPPVPRLPPPVGAHVPSHARPAMHEDHDVVSVCPLHDNGTALPLLWAATVATLTDAVSSAAAAPPQSRWGGAPAELGELVDDAVPRVYHTVGYRVLDPSGLSLALAALRLWGPSGRPPLAASIADRGQDRAASHPTIPASAVAAFVQLTFASAAAELAAAADAADAAAHRLFQYHTGDLQDCDPDGSAHAPGIDGAPRYRAPPLSSPLHPLGPTFTSVIRRVRALRAIVASRGATSSPSAAISFASDDVAGSDASIRALVGASARVYADRYAAMPTASAYVLRVVETTPPAPHLAARDLSELLAVGPHVGVPHTPVRVVALPPAMLAALIDATLAFPPGLQRRPLVALDGRVAAALVTAWGRGTLAGCLPGACGGGDPTVKAMFDLLPPPLKGGVVAFLAACSVRKVAPAKTMDVVRVAKLALRAA